MPWNQIDAHLFIKSFSKISRTQSEVPRFGGSHSYKRKQLLCFIDRYVWLHNENHIYQCGDFYSLFFPLLVTENLQNHLKNNNLSLNFSFWQYITNKKMDGQFSINGQHWFQSCVRKIPCRCLSHN
jgi:hypothetical protein